MKRIRLRIEYYSKDRQLSSPRRGNCCAPLLQLLDLSISLDSLGSNRREFNALHVGYFAVPPCTTVKVHTGAWPWPCARARIHTTRATPSYFADSVHARIGAARRVGIRATTARGKAIFLRSQLQREYDEAWRKYVSLNNLHNARDIGREGGGEKRENLAEIYIGGSRGEMFLA